MLHAVDEFDGDFSKSQLHPGVHFQRTANMHGEIYMLAFTKCDVTKINSERYICIRSVQLAAPSNLSAIPFNPNQ